MTWAALGAAMGAASAAVIFWFAKLIAPGSKHRMGILPVFAAMLMPWPGALGIVTAPVPDDGKLPYIVGWTLVAGAAGWRWLFRPRMRSREGL